MKQETIPHLQVPSDKQDKFVKPIDLRIYLEMRKYEDWETNTTFVSESKLAKDLSVSRNTIKTAIENLIADEYISKKQINARRVQYTFNPYKKFECFTQDFLNFDKIPIKDQSILIALQKLMIFDDGITGKISYSNPEIANKLNISEATLYRSEQSLRKANILTTVNNQLRNKETGCATQTKIFNLKEYCQHMIYAIMQNRARIEENTKEIQYLKDKVEAQGKLIQKLLAERKIENPEFIL